MPTILQQKNKINTEITSKVAANSISPSDVGINVSNNAGFVVTHAELVGLISSSSLLQGRKYLISDFRTTHYILFGEGELFQDTDSIITGDVEPIIVTAASVNTLHAEAISTIYPQDIIHYSINESDFTDDLSFYNASTSAIIGGFRGAIVYREDTVKKLSTHYDFRNVMLRRWESVTDPGVYDSTANNGGDHVDVNTFGNNCFNIIVGACYYKYSTINNITFGDECDSITFGDECNNITFGNSCSSIIFGKSCYSITFGNGCYSITFGNICHSITFVNSCGIITLGNICSNITFGNNAMQIILENSIDLNSVDFSSATHIYADYSKTIFKRSDGTNRLRYFNASDTLTIVNVNA